MDSPLFHGPAGRMLVGEVRDVQDGYIERHAFTAWRRYYGLNRWNISRQEADRLLVEEANRNIPIGYGPHDSTMPPDPMNALREELI